MTEEIFNSILGVLLVALGVLILIYKIRYPFKKDENVSSKAAYINLIGLAIVLIMIGIYLL
jgi:divalent metal cation (Fe/Co/Zn/Cd) transporter